MAWLMQEKMAISSLQQKLFTNVKKKGANKNIL